MNIRTTIFIITSILLTSCGRGQINSFRGDGKPFFDVQEIFFDERFPNVVVATDGTVITTWGRENYRVRRSEDGGKSWGPEITVANPGFQGGGTTVDENTGDIIVFVEEKHPIAPLTVYRSKDQGKTWIREEVEIKPNSLGHIPSMHMNEKGITLQNSQYSGRLIRPTRYYAGGNDSAFWDEHYTNAIYSDDRGKTWQAGEPFPANGTGEAAIAELSDGTLYYNSRRHRSTDGLNPRKRYVAKSIDGGETWRDMYVCEELPDGDQSRDYGLMGGLVRLPVDGHDILIFSNIESPEGRTHGTVWASFDGGRTWPVKKLAEEGSFAYSSLAAGRKGTPSEGIIYLFYESGSGAKMARFNLAWLTDGRHWKEFADH
jgi:sialidase-1